MSTQAIIRIVPRGGTRTVRQIRDQWTYLSRKGAVELQRSERHQGIRLRQDQLEATARNWAIQTGNYQPGQPEAESIQELTTHIVVSFPPGTAPDRAEAAGRAWTEEVFGSGRSGGTFDYVTAFHTDRDHPHMHVVVNRRALQGEWLKISRRHPQLNYDTLRTALVEAAYDNGIELDASSREERGIMERPITYAEYRRRMRLAQDVEMDDERDLGLDALPEISPEQAEALAQSQAGPSRSRGGPPPETEIAGPSGTTPAVNAGPSGTTPMVEDEPSGAGDARPERERRRNEVRRSIIETRAQKRRREEAEGQEAEDRRRPRTGDGAPDAPDDNTNPARPNARAEIPPSSIETRAQKRRREEAENQEADERSRRRRVGDDVPTASSSSAPPTRPNPSAEVQPSSIETRGQKRRREEAESQEAEDRSRRPRVEDNAPDTSTDDTTPTRQNRRRDRRDDDRMQLRSGRRVGKDRSDDPFSR